MSGTSNSNLLPLGLACAGVDHSSFDFSEDALCDTQHEEANVSDVALAVGLASGWIITFVFQDAFLVRLP